MRPFFFFMRQTYKKPVLLSQYHIHSEVLLQITCTKAPFLLNRSTFTSLESTPATRGFSSLPQHLILLVQRNHNEILSSEWNHFFSYYFKVISAPVKRQSGSPQSFDSVTYVENGEMRKNNSAGELLSQCGSRQDCDFYDVRSTLRQLS